MEKGIGQSIIYYKNASARLDELIVCLSGCQNVRTCAFISCYVHFYEAPRLLYWRGGREESTPEDSIRNLCPYSLYSFREDKTNRLYILLPNCTRKTIKYFSILCAVKQIMFFVCFFLANLDELRIEYFDMEMLG